MAASKQINAVSSFSFTCTDRIFAVNNEAMKKGLTVLVFVVCFSVAWPVDASAQCSICTKTAQQMGERPAKALNGGILYLAAMPFLIFGYIGYRWFKSNHETQ